MNGHIFFKQYLIWLVGTICCISACTLNQQSSDLAKQTAPLFQRLTTEETSISFENTITNTEALNIFEYRNFYNGGGVGIGDIDNDGLADVVFTANQGDNKLYKNLGDFKFEDITKNAGIAGKNKWSTGVVLVDINADGWLDIYICNAGIISGDNQKNELYINNKDLTFTEMAADYNLADNGFTTHAAFFDYDKDGDLDVYLLNNSFVPVSSLGYSDRRELRSEDWKVKEQLKGGGDKLLRNEGTHFVDVSKQAGIYGSLIGFGLGTTVGDVNNDGWSDIYVSNDFFERDYLYINQKDGTFSEEIETWAAHISLSSMGADLADINNDGHPDIFVTDMLVEDNERLKETSEFEKYDLLQLKQSKGFHKQYMQNTLQLNNGNQSFSEIAFYAGVATTDWSWGALMFDMDNDSHKDIFVSNGINHDVTNQDFMDFFADDILENMIQTGKKVPVDAIISKMPSTPIANYAFKNNGDLTFDNAATQWGFETLSFSNGAAYGDLDNDGDLDLIVNNVNQPAFVYNNKTNENSSNTALQVKLIGKGRNTFAIGSKVSIYTDGGIIHQQLQPSRGFQSSIDYILTIGTGRQTTVDSLVIQWPDGSKRIQKNIATNQLLTFDQNAPINTVEKTVATTRKPLLKKLNNQVFAPHQENKYIDFNQEGLIHKMLSKEGPILIVGDVDKNGWEDLFIGGAKGQAGQIYLQNENGFLKKESTAITDDLDFEDTAAAFFDANDDGHLDLMVGSGGNQIDGTSNSFDLRLYLNDGDGNFVKSTLQLPRNYYNTAVITPYDYDLDGDLDVFVGSRSIVGSYGLSPKHFLLNNDGLGNFKNVLKSQAPQLAQVGMVTDAHWKDMDKDGVKDLLTVEDWGAITIFLTKDEQLTPLATNLDQLNGHWQTLEATDIDGDGDIDLVLGNRGTNSIYKADSTNVLKMFVNDFDNNGTIEQIFTTTFKNKDVPIHLKRELTAQLPLLKKQNLQFAAYAQKSVNDLFPANKLKRAIKRTVNISESVLALNEGNNIFQIKKLPTQAQFSCINDLAILDLNHDGNKDIIFGGNDYALKPQFSQLDASYGGVLLGNGKGDFQWLAYQETGLFEKGVITSIKTLTTNTKTPKIIIGINNAPPALYTCTPPKEALDLPLLSANVSPTLDD